MKKLILMAVASMALAQNASASCSIESFCGVMSFTGVATTMAPTWTVAGPFMLTTEALKNDVIQVQGEAFIALETGIVSQELKSVVDKMRFEMDSLDMRSLSDMQIVALIASGVQ